MAIKDIESTPECMQEETKLITGPCPECGAELEFFSTSELRNTSHCYECKKPFDPEVFAKKQGIAI
ncbi:MAG: hypothetical protein LBF22_06705 [Deltaproteobacteria bacterium]|nr:hypothetical protein [Deltaproteobacteria bacterium]